MFREREREIHPKQRSRTETWRGLTAVVKLAAAVQLRHKTYYCCATGFRTELDESGREQSVRRTGGDDALVAPQ